MKNVRKENLESLYDLCIERANDDSLSIEERELAFKNAMSVQDQINKLENRNLDLIIKVIEIAAMPVFLTVLDNSFKRKTMKEVCLFEKDYSFTTTPGRGFSSSLFRFKR